MKKITLIAALVMLGGSLFAYGLGADGSGMMGRGAGVGAAIDWKVGTVVTTEYKKVTGQLIIGQYLSPVFKADGVEYQLRLPRKNELSTVKNGDTIVIEGTFTSVKSDAKVSPVVHPFKVTINGKEIDLTSGMGYGRGNRMGGAGFRG